MAAPAEIAVCLGLLLLWGKEKRQVLTVSKQHFAVPNNQVLIA